MRAAPDDKPPLPAQSEDEAGVDHARAGVGGTGGRRGLAELDVRGRGGRTFYDRTARGSSIPRSDRADHAGRLRHVRAADRGHPLIAPTRPPTSLRWAKMKMASAGIIDSAVNE